MIDSRVEKVLAKIAARGWVDPDGPVPEGFPLGVSNNGQYCRKHNGVRHQFGAVTLGWRAAYANYLKEWTGIVAGKKPKRAGREGKVRPLTAKELANRYLGRQMERTQEQSPDARPLSKFSFVELRIAVEIAVAALGEDKVIDELLPDNYAQWRIALARHWKRDPQTNKWVMLPGQVGADTFKRRIRHVRSMLRWASPPPIGQGLIQAPRWGESFKPVALAAIKRARREAERQHGPKSIPPEQIPHILEACDIQMKAMVLLGLLCGFTETDCAVMPRRVVNYERRIIDYDRVKTLMPRQAAMVPALAAALKDAEAARPSPADPTAIAYQELGSEPVRMEDLMFVTERGQLWAEHGAKDDPQKKDGVPARQTHQGRLARRFDTLLRGLDKRFPQGVGGMKFKRARVSFGSLRHTFKTHAERMGDPNLVALVMGHSRLDISRMYDHPIEQDLHRLARFVHDRLFGSEKVITFVGPLLPLPPFLPPGRRAG